MSPLRLFPFVVSGLFSLLATPRVSAADKTPETKTPPASAAPSAALPINQDLVKARDGVVIIERAGRIVGVGSILQGDGRVLTAYSSVAQGGDFDIRYPDGASLKALITQSDRATDLALLTVNGEPRKVGLKASRSHSETKTVNTFNVAPAKKLVPARLAIKGSSTFVATSGKTVGEGFELATLVKGTDVGAPLLNDNGEVIAIIARACTANSKANCAAVPYGAPVTLIRNFLRGAVSQPERAELPAPAVPWLGLDVTPGAAGPVRGVRITQIHADSPAAAAGLKAGYGPDADLLVALGGVPIANSAGLLAALRERKIGDSAELLVFGSGRFRQVSLVIKPAPAAAAAPKPTTPPPLRAPATGSKPAPSKPAPAPGAPRNH